MRFILVFLLILTLSGCLTSSYEEECPPLRWHEGGFLYSNMELSGGHPYLSVGIRTNEKEYTDLLSLVGLNVTCTLVNKGDNDLKIGWIATTEEEKEAGKIVITFDNGEEDRKIVLKKNEKVIWYAGKFDELVNAKFITIQDFGKNKKWNVALFLEFKNTDKLKELVDVSKFEIPVSAYSSDNI